MSDQLGPIERVQPPALPPSVKREREHPDDGRRRSRGDDEPPPDDGDQDDDGLPHVDVRA